MRVGENMALHHYDLTMRMELHVQFTVGRSLPDVVKVQIISSFVALACQAVQTSFIPFWSDSLGTSPRSHAPPLLRHHYLHMVFGLLSLCIKSMYHAATRVPTLSLHVSDHVHNQHGPD